MLYMLRGVGFFDRQPYYGFLKPFFIVEMQRFKTVMEGKNWLVSRYSSGHSIHYS